MLSMAGVRNCFSSTGVFFVTLSRVLNIGLPLLRFALSMAGVLRTVLPLLPESCTRSFQDNKNVYWHSNLTWEPQQPCRGYDRAVKLGNHSHFMAAFNVSTASRF